MNKELNKGVFVVSLGCPKNFVDTEIIAGGLLVNGRELVFDPSEADIYLVSTCAFIPAARDEANSEIQHAVKWKKQHRKGKIVVCGCLIQWDKSEEYRTIYPEVDVWIGVDKVEELPKMLDDLEAGKLNNTTYYRNSDPHYLYNEKTPRLQLTVEHFAYLKIADGCNNCCTYCSIPNIRGRLRSRSIPSVVEEARNLLRNGVKELVLIAQDITAFGADQDDVKVNLSELLRQLDELEGKFWIRLLYTHPAHFTEELMDVVAESKHVLHYFDIPLQHINNNILQRMNRHVTRERIEEIIRKLRSRMPEVVIRTTFITGFPGESEADYQELLDFVRNTKFSRLGVFGYSPEPRTPAAEFENQIPIDEANRRAAEIMSIQAEISRQANRKLIGQELEVLIDEVMPGGKAFGRGYLDAAEIDSGVMIDCGKKRVKAGRFCQVKITGGGKHDLSGRLVR